VIALNRTDAGEHLPRHAVTVSGVPVKREVALRDVPLDVRTGLGLDRGPAAGVRAEHGGEHAREDEDEQRDNRREDRREPPGA
jgi:hypothetical protein